MKTRTLITVSALIMVAFVLIGGDLAKKIKTDKAMEAICHTWTRPRGIGTKKDVYKHDGTYEWYSEVDSPEPRYTGKFEIEKAWSDREGNIWIYTWSDYAGGSNTLFKISNSGTVIELIRYNEDTSPHMEGKEFAYMRCLPSYNS